MENIQIDLSVLPSWATIFWMCVFIIICFNLLKSVQAWTVGTTILSKPMNKPEYNSIQTHLYWIGRGLHSIYWLIILFMAIYIRRS